MRIGALHWLVSLIMATVVHVVVLVFFVQPQARVSTPKEVATGVVIELGDETVNPREDAGTENAPRASAPDLGADSDTLATTPAEVPGELAAEEADTRVDAEQFDDRRPDEVAARSQSAPLPEVVDLAAVTSRSDLVETAPTQLVKVDDSNPTQATELTAPSVSAANLVDTAAPVDAGNDVAVHAPSPAVTTTADVASAISVDQTPTSAPVAIVAPLKTPPSVAPKAGMAFEVPVEQTRAVSSSGLAPLLSEPAAVVDPPETPPSVTLKADLASEVPVEQTRAVVSPGSAPLLSEPVAVVDPLESPPPVAAPVAVGAVVETPAPSAAPVARVPVSGPVLDLPAVSPAAEAELTVRAPAPVTDKAIKDLPVSTPAKAPVEGAVVDATIVAAAVDVAAASPVAPGESRKSRPPTHTVTMRQGTIGVTAQYQGLLTAWLQKHMRYPWAARVNGYEGTAVLRFTIRRDGTVVAARLERSSGYAVLDDEAVEILRRAEPFPSIPPEMLGSELELRVPVKFFWKDFLKQQQAPTIYLE